MLETRVVNITSSLYDVYIGREGHGLDGYFGNPIVIGRSCPQCRRTHRDKKSIIKCYGVWFLERIKKDREFKRRIIELWGLTLGCFCHPEPCHGDVIVQWLTAYK